MTRLALALLATVALSPLARAADVALPSRIDAVTVFPDAAAVTRIGEARLPQGQHVVLLRGLPAALDPASIRVEARGEGGLVIGSADVRRSPGEAQPAQEHARLLKELRVELARVRGRIEAIEAQKRAVADFARIAAEAAGKDGAGFDVDRARAAWLAVGEGTAQANEGLIVEQARAADVEAEIRAVEATIGRGRPPALPVVDLAIAVEAEREGAAQFSVTYRVAGARWTAVYDARLDTQANGAAKLELVRRAAVTQRTGEDWTDVALTLSTARVTGGSSAPEVQTQALNLREAMAALSERNRTLAAPAPAAPMAADAMRRQGMEAAPAQEQEAAVNVTAFSASFSPPGRLTVGRDGATRTFRLSSHALDAALTARVAPSLEPRAYLSAGVTWADDAPLLPGEVSLTRDGVFVGKARLGAIAGGEQFDLGFGADDRIKVERVPVRRRDNDPSGWNASRTQIVDHRTIVTNLHRRPMRISVVDRIPVSDNSAITVEALPTNTAPTERTVQDRRGVMGWTHDYQPGEKREIRLGWRLRWPADRDLVTN